MTKLVTAAALLFSASVYGKAEHQCEIQLTKTFKASVQHYLRTSLFQPWLPERLLVPSGVEFTQEPLNDFDKKIWQHSIKDKKESGYFAAYSKGGDLIEYREIRTTFKSHIDPSKDSAAFLKSLNANSRLNDVAVIRVSHTHPGGGTVFSGEDINFLLELAAIIEASEKKVQVEFSLVTRPLLPFGPAIKRTLIIPPNRVSFLRGDYSLGSDTNRFYLDVFRRWANK